MRLSLSQPPFSLSDAVAANIDAISQLRDGITRLNERQYNWRRSPSCSSVGRHTRHIIDHYDCFLSGIDGAVINYDHRSRDVHLEMNLESALRSLQHCEQELHRVNSDDEEVTIAVYISAYQAAPAMAESSMERELIFLQSHTIHHMAIIRLLLDLQGIELPAEFGIAVSTIKFGAAPWLSP